MATTASALLAGTDGACVAHVGDSRVYVLRDDGLEQITHDHSWVEEQVRAGTMSPTAARQHPWRNVVTRALSGGEDPEVDVTQISPAGRAVSALLGRPVLGGQRRADRRRSWAIATLPLDQVCRVLIEAANAAGGPDNITALVLEVDAP